MQFAVLGPVSVRDGGDEIPLPGLRRRALLLRLLIDADRVVPADRLVDDLWEGTPPPGAASTLQSHVSHLRRIVGHDRLVSRASGYVLALGAGDDLDRDGFERDVAAGRGHLERGEFGDAAGAFEAALACWRGRALIDAAGASWAAAEVARLEELRAAALESLLEADLARGGHREVIGRAEAAVAEHPLRERLWVHLIIALYRDGRQADALRAYQRVRLVLADELGIDPGPELRSLEAAVLAQDETLNPGPRSAAPAAGGAPAGLPTGVVTFLLTDVVGSTRLWESAPEAMDEAVSRHESVVRVAVEGHGGVVLKSRGEGDSTFSVFRRATDAAAGAADLQAALDAEVWPVAAPFEVRMALHTGEATERHGDYFGRTVNRAARLRSAAQGSQILVSQATATLLADRLPAGHRLAEAGVLALQDLDRPEPVYVLLATSAADRFKPLARTYGNLPQLMSTLVGREHEIATLTEELARAGVVTLVGPGGVGKTHLAVAVAGRVAAEFPGGAWIVDLSGLRDATQVADVVAAALGVPPLPGRPAVDAVVERFRARPALVVLDNCEHLLDGVAGLVARILSAATTGTVLATSREHLGLAGERTFTVRPLELPTDDQDGKQRDCAAVRLFVERASAARPDFTLTDANAPVIGRLCRRLDGLPLAIELAAARVRSFTPAEIEEHLQERFTLLRAERGTPRRHQRLVDAVDWSYGLLDDDERRLLRRLSAFTGGCDLDAVVDVFGRDEEVPATIADVLDRLVEKSLVVADPTGDRTRYRMLETIREYARDQLDATEEAEAVRRRFAEYVARLLAEESLRLRSPDERVAIDRIDRELDNIRAALDWAVNAGDVDLAFSLITSVETAHPTGFAANAKAGQVARMPGAAGHPRYPSILAISAWLADIYGTEDDADVLLAEAVRRSRGADPGQHGLVLSHAVSRLIFTNRIDEAKHLADELVDLASQLDDPLVSFNAWSHTASIRFINGDDISEAAARELVAARRLGTPSLIAIAHFHLGWAQPDLVQSVEYIDRGLVLAGSVRNEFTRSVGLNMLAILHARQHDHAAALRALLQAVRGAWTAGQFEVGLNLNYIAGLLALHGRDEAACMLRAAAPALNKTPLMNQILEDAVRDLPARVGPARIADIEQRAAALTPPRLLDYITDEVEHLIATLASEAPPTAPA